MADTATIAVATDSAHDRAASRPAAHGGARSREVGVRRCAVTRAKRPQAELLRFVVDPEGVVTPDVAGRLPGRGVWVTPDRAILAKAIGAGRFRAGFKADVIVPDDLPAQVVRQLDRRIEGLIGLARSAGEVAAGWEQAREFARKRRIGLILVASDAAEGARRRLEALAPDAPAMDELDAATLGAALGRDRVVNALVANGRLAKMISLEAARRRGLVGGTDDGAAAATPRGKG